MRTEGRITVMNSLRLIPRRLLPPISFSTAYGSMAEHPCLLLESNSSDGAIHRGECSPLPGYSVESVSEIVDYWNSSGASRFFRSLEHDLAVAAHSELMVGLQACLNVIERIPLRLPSLRFGLESLLMSWLTHHHGVSKEDVWRLHYPTRASELTAVSSTTLLDLMRPDSWQKALDSASTQTSTVVKVKLGRPGMWLSELKQIEVLRSELERLTLPGAQIRCDANRGLTIPQVLELCAAIPSNQLDLIEEPVGSLEELVELHIQLKSSAFASPALFLDESLHRADLRQSIGTLLQDKVIQGIVLKPTCMGGIAACLDWAAMAKDCEAGCVVTHTHEGEIAFEDCILLARLLGGRWAHGIDREWCSHYSPAL